MVVCQDEMDTYYLDNLDEYINDEGRIVTYKWLSLTLGVHSNVAKQMLHHFATLQRSDGGGGDLTLTYMVSGVVEESGSDGRLQKVVKVVREREVEAARASMKAVSSIHVYSVQKSALPDVGVLYGANYDVMKQHLSNTSRYSGIRCSEAQVSPSTGRLQQVVEEVTLPIQKNVPKIDQKEENKKTNPKLDNTTKSTTTTSKHTNQIASMFAQQSKKQEGSQKTVAKEEKAPAKPKGGGISAFFTKGTAQRKPNTTAKSDTPASGLESDSSPCLAKSKGSLVAEDPQQNPKGMEDSKELEIVQEKKLQIKEEEEEKTKSGGCAKKMKTNKVTSSSSQKKRKSKGLKSEPKIKRSRIMQLSDSDSDESAKEEDSEEEEEKRLLLLPSPPPPVRVYSDSEEEREGEKSLHPSTSLKEEVKPGMRKKKVDETFVNEEGYFVTNKVYKLVNLTEEEIKQEEEEKKDEEEKIKKKEEERKIKEEEERKKEKSSPPVKRDSSPSSSSPQKKKRGGKKEDNKKQSNITSFFSKK